MSNIPTALVGLLLSTGVAFAQTTQPAPAPTPAAPNTAPTSPASEKKSEFEAAKAVKSNLAAALAAAESKGGEGRAIDADFEQASGDLPVRWEIKVVYPDGKLVEHFVNADTAALIKSEDQPYERYFTRLKADDFQKATTPLKDALAIAEQKAGGGKAYEAEVEREGEAVAYEISVATADKSVEVKVGPDGKVIGD